MVMRISGTHPPLRVKSAFLPLGLFQNDDTAQREEGQDVEADEERDQAQDAVQHCEVRVKSWKSLQEAMALCHYY